MEGQPQIENLMLAANCNTVINSISFNRAKSLLAYAAANTVLILDPYNINGNIPKVLFSLKGHQDRVNAVQWLDDRSLVSISSDKSFIIWTYEAGSDPRLPQNWKLQTHFKNAHEYSITYMRTYNPNESEYYILTTCVGGALKLWQGTSAESIQFKDQLIFGKNLQEAMGMIHIGDKHLMLVVGGYDRNIHVYLVPRIQHQKESKSQFKYKFSLLGHFNSIRDFDFTQILENNIRYMASCSQDSNIRIWKIQPLENISESYGGHDDLKRYESKTSYVLQDDEESKVYNITLESIMVSHQEAVSSIQWGKRSESDAQVKLHDFCLLSSSFDFTVCIWKPDETSEIWSADSTLGAMQGNKHAYYGAIFLKDDEEILAYTFNGAFHQWRKTLENQWLPELTVKGHFGEVSDLDWDQHNASLISCSQDQTTRLFSKFGQDKGWFEFGRPQVHGYDMNTLSTLKVNSTSNLPSKILSGGDEKVLRLFEAPYSFVKIFNQLHPDAKEIQLKYSDTKSNEEIEKMIGSEAKKQPLGLMNKPQILLANQNMRVDEEEGGGIGPDFDPNKILSNVKDKENEIIDDLAEPPVEDILMVKTLWPEQQKLYGHAFEIFCLATSHNGDCAASASKAKEKKYSDIIIWDLRKGQTSVPSCRLSAHNLTVVQLEFSNCDQYLLSCSRDRSWALFKREAPENLQFTLLKKVKEAHSRIIWGISWSHDDKLFASASREKQKSIKVWNGTNNGEIGTLHSELPEENPSATAIRFFPSLVRKENYSLAIGLESGDMYIWSYVGQQWSKMFEIPNYYAHCLAVRRIKFNLRYSNAETDDYMVASCGNDHTVRLFKIKL